MKNIYKIGIGAAALTLIAGGNAMAGKGQWVMKGQAPKDTVKVAKDTVANVPESAVVDEVIWVVGDEPILKSDVETMRLQGQMEGMQWKGDPDCAIPEQMAVQKLFLHQAEIDSIEVSESEVTTSIDQQINYWISMAGSKEKLEEYRNQTVAQMRQQMRDEFKNQQRIEKMRKELVKDVATTPSEVRKYFDKLPVDSLPFVPVEVEVQIITRQPKATREEINKVKEELRNFTDRVNRGETSFATMARLYSEDPESARRGGELDYVGRGMLDPAFANVAFNLTDPKKISKIVESEFGFHIIQLIDKRVDTTKGCIALFTGMLDTMKFNKDVMRKSAAHGFTNATDAADYLVNHGVPFRDAHGIIGRIVLYCLDKQMPIDDMSLEELKQFSPVFEEDVYDAISMETCVNKRLTIGAPGEEAMKKVIAIEEAYLEKK